MRKPESAKAAFKATEILLCGIKEQVLPETGDMKSVLFNAQCSPAAWRTKEKLLEDFYPRRKRELSGCM